MDVSELGETFWRCNKAENIRMAKIPTQKRGGRPWVSIRASNSVGPTKEEPATECVSARVCDWREGQLNKVVCSDKSMMILTTKT